jgi:hypothetical protein
VPLARTLAHVGSTATVTVATSLEGSLSASVSLTVIE